MKNWRSWGVATAGFGMAVAAPTALAQLANGGTVAVAQTEQSTRLAFSFAARGVSVSPIQNGDVLELVFSQSNAIDISELRSTPPRFVRAVTRLARGDGRFAIGLQLEPGVRHRQFSEAGAIVIDLTRPAPQPPAPASLTGPLQVTETREATEFRVSWSRPVRAAIVQRGEAAWMVFDQAASIDVRNARRAGRRHAGVVTAPVEGGAAVRIALAAEMRVSARAEGAAWIVRVAADAPARPAAPVRREMGPDGRGRLAIGFGRGGVALEVRDPVLQDSFLVGLLDGPVLGVDAQRAAPEAVALPAAHGALIAPRQDNVAARFEADQFIVTVGDRDVVPLTMAYTPTEASLGARSILDLSSHQAAPLDLVLDRKAALERAAAQEGVQRGASARARLDLARFLIAHELSAEALGALAVATLNQPQLSYDPGFRLLRGIASAMLGRSKDAEADLAASGLANDPIAALWRGYVALENGASEAAQRNLERGRDALPTVSPAMRTRFLLALAEAAVQNGDLPAAKAAASAAEEHARRQNDRDHARLLTALVLRAGGETEDAADIFKVLSASGDERVSARASLEFVRAQRASSKITLEAAAEALDALRFRWRGDGFELAVNQTLGAIYVEMGRWRDGLEVMLAAANRFPNHPIGRQLRQDTGALFESLFLDGEADKLEPVQALGLFYDFQDLTPIGPNGDRMVRALAARLVGLDLLEQAGDLLKHQVEQRLQGMARSQIAADLAMIYLQDKRAELALTTLASTRQPRMPAQLLSERRILEAKAQLELGRPEIALELLQREASVDAQRLRAEIAWRGKDWAAALQTLQALCAMLPKDGALEDADRAVVMRTAIAAAMAENAPARAALRRDFSARMSATPDADGFEIVTGDLDVEGATIRDLAGRIAQTDLLDRFMQRMRERMSPSTQAGVRPNAAPS